MPISAVISAHRLLYAPTANQAELDTSTPSSIVIILPMNACNCDSIEVRVSPTTTYYYCSQTPLVSPKQCLWQAMLGIRFKH